MNTVLLASISIIVLIGILLIAISQDKVRQNWYRNWKKNPNPDKPDNIYFEGEWSGHFSTSSLHLEPVTQDPDYRFSMNLRKENTLFEGKCRDSLGLAVITGICDYPDIRFTKRYYESHKIGYEVGVHLGELFYQGQIHADNKAMSGTWFQDPMNRSKRGGRWQVLLDSPLQESPNIVKAESQKEKDTFALENTNFNTIDKLESKAENTVRTESQEMVSVSAFSNQSNNGTTNDISQIKFEKPDEIPSYQMEAISKEIELSSTFEVETEELQSKNIATSGVTGNIICTHCQTETPTSFDFCLYCSNKLG